MRVFRYLAVSVFVGALMPGAATAAFNCTGESLKRFAAVCGDAQIMQLDWSVAASLARAVHATDPVSAMLLQRDQDWFADIVGSEHAEFRWIDDAGRQRISAILQQRLAMLDHLAGRAGGIPGEWRNAFGTAKITALEGGLLRVEIHTSVTYLDSEDAVTCALAAQIQRADDGWLSGPAVRIEGANNFLPIVPDSAIRLRARLQANTLRIVISRMSAAGRFPEFRLLASGIDSRIFARYRRTATAARAG